MYCDQILKVNCYIKSITKHYKIHYIPEVYKTKLSPKLKTLSSFYLLMHELNFRIKIIDSDAKMAHDGDTTKLIINYLPQVLVHSHLYWERKYSPFVQYLLFIFSLWNIQYTHELYCMCLNLFLFSLYSLY